MMKLLLPLVSILLMAGCATPPMSEHEAAALAAMANRPTLVCEAACTFYDPRDRVSIPRPTNSNDVAIAAMGFGERTLLGLGIPFFVKEGVRHVVDGFTAFSDRTDYVTTNTYTDSSRIDNSVGDYAGTASGNEGQIIEGNRGRIWSDDRYTDTTHEPTVVYPEVVIPMAP